METVHDCRISIAKALCIILMVIGHSGESKQLGIVIYLFHMPAFFFVSGYLFKEKYFDNTWQFVKLRFKGLWWPFVKWSLIFALLHNVFTALHLYANFYSLHDFIVRSFHILTLTGSEQLLGGYWFLKELLYASLIAFFSLKLLRKTLAFTLLDKSVVILIIIFLIMAFILSILPFKIPTISSLTLLATAFYTSGYWFSKQSFGSISRLWVGIVSFVIIVVVSFFFQGFMEVKSTDIFLYFVIALVGTYGMINISGIIAGRARNILDYIGSRTLYILTFHFISFKLVSLIKIWQYDLPIEKLAEFPVIGVHNEIYWFAYSTIGTILPILLWQFMNKLQIRLKIKTIK